MLRGVRDSLAPHAGEGIRWSAESTWHVTLQFLGQTSDERAACVISNLREIHAAPASVRIEGVGFFERAGIFYAGIGVSPEVIALQQQVTAATCPCGFAPEARPWHPHITLAKTKGRSGTRALAPLKQEIRRGKDEPFAEFLANEFLLYESFPGPEGSRYEVRARFPLSANR